MRGWVSNLSGLAAGLRSFWVLQVHLAKLLDARKISLWIWSHNYIFPPGSCFLGYYSKGWYSCMKASFRFILLGVLRVFNSRNLGKLARLLRHQSSWYLSVEELCRNPIHKRTLKGVTRMYVLWVVYFTKYVHKLNMIAKKAYFDVGRVSLWIWRHNSSTERYQLSWYRSNQANLPRLRELKALKTLLK